MAIEEVRKPDARPQAIKDLVADLDVADLRARPEPDAGCERRSKAPEKIERAIDDEVRREDDTAVAEERARVAGGQRNLRDEGYAQKASHVLRRDRRLREDPDVAHADVRDASGRKIFVAGLIVGQWDHDRGFEPVRDAHRSDDVLAEAVLDNLTDLQAIGVEHERVV